MWSPVPLQVQKSHFENGKTDAFVVGREDDLGELKGLTVRLDSKSLFADTWELERVTVTNLLTGRAWTFLANTWISAAPKARRDAMRCAAMRRGIGSASRPEGAPSAQPGGEEI